MRRVIQPLIFAVSTLVAAVPAAAQLDSAALMQEGNALTRSGIHRTALLRYREAAAAGLDTPLLYYNLGVVHYRLEQYDDATRAFERAATDPALSALALYNLGLVQRAAGDSAAAQSSFRAAADGADRRDLRKLAERAIATFAEAEPRARGAARASTAASAETASRVGEFRFAGAARIGQDDNVYRSPSDPYVDLADSAQPTVTPRPQTATFMPVDLLAEYVLHNEAGDTDFIFAYQLDGDFFAAELANANRVSQRFSMGADIVLGEREQRRRTLQSAFFVRDHQETNFDPDDGLDRDIDGVDISERFSYQASGVQGEFEHRLGDWRWGFDLRFERREYQQTPPVANYDHEYSFTTASIEYDLNDATVLSFGLRRYRRLYDERLARDLNGNLLATNLPQHYDYRGVQLGLVKRVGRAIELHFDYLRLDRIDEFLGYYDYAQDALRLRAVLRPSSRFYLSLGAIARTYDYPNAFAFNEPTAGPRELEAMSGELLAEFRITRKLSLWAEVEISDVTSTDSRAEYARTRTMLGARWRRR